MSMVEITPDGVKLKQLHQVGIIVKNVAKVAENYWNILGIGPHVMFTIDPIPGYRMTYKGKQSKYRFIASFCQVGPVEIELLQSLEGSTIYNDYIREHIFSIIQNFL